MSILLNVCILSRHFIARERITEESSV